MAHAPYSLEKRGSDDEDGRSTPPLESEMTAEPFVVMKTICLCCVLGLLAFGGAVQAQTTGTAKNADAEVSRGELLARFGGCHDCHTPKIMTAKGPQPDTSRLLSGHPASAPLPAVPLGVVGPNEWGALASNDLTAWAGPWGISFAANLTPDVTGLGPWNEQLFIQTMRTGKHLGVGRDLLPPMPWFNLEALSDQDLKALFKYLQSLKPISNQVPQPIPPQARAAQVRAAR
jgi:mono/diheme cytochrome c family protein